MGMRQHGIAARIRRLRFSALPIVAGVVGGAALLLYFVVLCCFFPRSYWGHDTDHFLHWQSADFEYALSPLDVSVMSPFQGLGGLAQPLAVWINPAYIVPHLFTPTQPQAGGTVAAMVLMAVATFLLGRSLGLPCWLAVFGAEVVSVFSLEPMAYYAMRIGPVKGLSLFTIIWGCAVPSALGTLLVAVFCYLGRLSRPGNLLCAP